MKNNASRGYRNDLFKDTADRKGDNIGALEQSEFGRRHTECETAWKEEKKNGLKESLVFREDVEAIQNLKWSFDEARNGS